MTKGESLENKLRQANDKLISIVQLENTEVHQMAAIQVFEFTFELAWKYLKERLEAKGIQAYAPRDVIREAGKAGLIDSVEKWLDFQNKRNLTTHTYNKDIADEVYEAAKIFPALIEEII